MSAFAPELGTVADAQSATPDQFLGQTEAGMLDIHEAIGATLDKVLDMIKVSALLSPLGAGGMYLVFRGVRDRVWDRWTEVQEEIWSLVEEVLGNPAKLIALGSSYTATATDLSGIASAMHADSLRVDDYWTGRAAAAYATSVGRQAEATENVAAILRDTTGVVTDSATSLAALWLFFPKQLARAAGDIAAALGGIADAGNWLTLGAGPILDIVNTVLQHLIDAVDKLEEYLFGLVGQRVELDQFLSRNSGFPLGQWPQSASQDIMDDPAEWDLK